MAARIFIPSLHSEHGTGAKGKLGLAYAPSLLGRAPPCRHLPVCDAENMCLFSTEWEWDCVSLAKLLGSYCVVRCFIGLWCIQPVKRTLTPHRGIR